MEIPCTLYYQNSNQYGNIGACKLSINVDSFKKSYKMKSKKIALDGFYNTETTEFRQFSYSTRDWMLIFSDYLLSNKQENKYYYTSLLRRLYYFNLTLLNKEYLETAIRNTIQSYPDAKEWFIRDLWNYAAFISYDKRTILLDIFQSLGYSFENGIPQILYKAYQETKQEKNNKASNLNLFTLFNTIYNNIHISISTNH